MPRHSVAALIEALSSSIREGRLPPGTQLPTHRQLAARHGLALASASKIYARLGEMGLVIGETGRGTFVRDHARQRDWDSSDEARLNASALDLSFNHPDHPEQAALLRTMLRELAAAGDPAILLRQPPPGGRMRERASVSAFLAKTRNIEASPERIFLVNGAQQGLYIAAAALLAPHDRLAADALTYPGLRMLAAAQHLEVLPIPCLSDGPDLTTLDRLCRQHRVSMIHAMPTLHNPLGWVLSHAQRLQLVDIARRHDCWLLEDAAYAYLEARPPPALASLAPERTIHVSSLSKSLASGLRFGFMIVPDHCATRIRATIRAACWSLPGIVSAMAVRWLDSGTVLRQETYLRNEWRKRQILARNILDGMDMTAHPAAPFLWLRLPEGLRMDRIATALATRNIAVSKAEAYATTRHAPHALRLALASVPFEKLGPALSEVRATIEAFPPQ
ncbi:PLP-dependent aminotransferase family protein [Alcaligenaceae bacterium SJ-26]|nr:PLP-dependent aminotransferase family protein [Alcaligenaceae bacterium SJ-26]